MNEKYNFQYCPKIVVLSADRTKVLLCKRIRETDYDGVFSFPGGKMETGDASIVDAIRREKNEELGPDFKIKLYTTFSTSVLFKKQDGSYMVLPHYLATHEDGEVVLNQQEYSEYTWVKIEKLESFEPKIENIPKTTREALRLLPFMSSDDSIVV